MRPLDRRAFLCGALLLLTRPSVAAARDRVVLAFGDSLTAGHGLTPGEAYPALLETRLAAAGYGYRVVNAGVSGDTTAGGLRRVDWALKLQPEVVIVALGANDGLRGLDLAAVRANLDRIVERFQAAGVKVLLAGMRLPPNYGQPYADDFERVFRAVAQRRGVPLMPFLLDGVGGQAPLNQSDGIHPTAEGQRIMADRLWPYLVPLLAK
jgi:acyl-CoA thioesterase-1